MNRQINKILYTTDLSKNSSYAFIHAVDLANKYDAKIVIMHVIEPIPPSYEVYGVIAGVPDPEQQEITIEQIKNHLQGFCQKAEAHIGSRCTQLVTNIVVSFGYPPVEILETADKEGCDLIVMGTHGKGFLAHTFLGSVSSSVLHRTRKPVFIIPLPSEKVDLGWDSV